MAKLRKFFLGILFLPALSFALSLDWVAVQNLQTRDKFEKTTMGGFSGLVFDKQEALFYIVSDDRGNVNEPRFYKFQIKIDEKSIQAIPKSVHFFKADASSLSHAPILKPAQYFSKVLDLEAIAILPWGDLLFSNEGDHNHKPRVDAQIFSASKEGVIRREYELPKAYLAEKTGEQKTGVQNNAGFEGLAASPDGKSFLAALEAPLTQEKNSKKIRFLQFDIADAFVLKAGREYNYPLTENNGEIQRGVSEILFVNDHELLVLERAVGVGTKGPEFYVDLFLVSLDEKSSEGLLSKKKVLDFRSIQDKTGPTDNFEAMSWGPNFSDGSRSLIIVSDDNFKKMQKTQFLLFKVK